ncbi:MAG TPA: mandelate racemase/muconate lactonizing enzyme family protein [Acidobacteriota bacterium]|nr:mandelate racemase/muconate lactonizing enzyme family protein [Acidobacteriota bacterium]
MKITSLEPFILHVPVTGNRIEDSTHQVSCWGAPGVIIHTDEGLSGFGYTGTHAHLPSDRLITSCISDCYGPLLLGRDPEEVQALWDCLFHFPPLLWVGRKGITQLALSAVDTALWDLKAKKAGVPLWKLLGGENSTVLEAYNTDGGWLNWDQSKLVADCRRLVLDEGFRGVKIKIGRPDYREDLRRIEAVRAAIGPECRLMVDANGRFDLPTALRIGAKLKDYDVFWFEEPLWYQDVKGHAELARKIETPVALGEQLYGLDDFETFISANAVHFVQADAVRLAGVTEWWRVADLALAHRLPVAPHIGDMMQIHLHLAVAHPACRLMEYIPWLRRCFRDPVTVKDGRFVLPDTPGAGTTLRPDALDQFNVL